MLKISDETKDIIALFITAGIICTVSGWILYRILSWKGAAIEMWLRGNVPLLMLMVMSIPFVIWACVDYHIIDKENSGKRTVIKGLRVISEGD